MLAKCTTSDCTVVFWQVYACIFHLRRARHLPAMSMQFFGCYFNLFRLMAKCGVLQNLLRKEHVHTFVNTGGDVRELDFRFFVGDKKIGAPFHGLKAFFTTPQLSVLDKVRRLLVYTHCCAISHTSLNLYRNYHPEIPKLRQHLLYKYANS